MDILLKCNKTKKAKTQMNIEQCVLCIIAFCSEISHLLYRGYKLGEQMHQTLFLY